MKNTITISAAVILLFIIGLGCSFINGGSSSNTAGASNSTDPNAMAKTGVAECDDLIDLLNRDKSDPNDSFFARKAKEYAIDFAKDSIKKNIEENKGDKQKIADGCKEFKNEYLKNKEKNNQNQNSSEKSGNTQKS